MNCARIGVGSEMTSILGGSAGNCRTMWARAPWNKAETTIQIGHLTKLRECMCPMGARCRGVLRRCLVDEKQLFNANLAQALH